MTAVTGLQRMDKQLKTMEVQKAAVVERHRSRPGAPLAGLMELRS